jgi:hypothetical protein
MTTIPTRNIKEHDGTSGDLRQSVMARLLRRSAIRELFIVVGFCLLTSTLTWPYVTRLRDAVAGPGDPYLLSWILWWDYHQTFTDPLNLFHANILYPYRYTLAFSEHSYGLALPFFPLFALGFRPLTVHAVAMFLGFALSGYGAFRLARTLTNSYGAAWVAGIVFAFVPYRFNLMAQLVYLFSMWIPLLFEALVLFVRSRTRKRAAWLGFAFFMTGLTTISWLLLAIIPLVVWGVILLTRHELWRDRDFWRRGAVGLGVASVALTPFIVPFYIVSRMYGFKRRIEEVKAHSAQPIHWLVAEGRNRLWRGLGSQFPDAAKFQMFPGLLAPLLALGELLLNGSDREGRATLKPTGAAKILRALDTTIIFLFGLSIVAVGFDRTPEFDGLFNFVTSEASLSLLSIAVITRMCIAYPRFLRRESSNLIETIRSDRRTDAFWLGVILSVVGFMYSIGWNFFFYRILYDVMPGFKSMRAPMRGAVFAYLGIGLLAALGSIRTSELISQKAPRLRRRLVYLVLCGLLLLEFNAAPLYFIRGDVFPDQVTLRLKNTPMRGGIAYLPAGVDYNTRYMLRAADHEKPLITATSGFDPPYLDEIQKMTREGFISQQLMTVLEQIPASYLVIEYELIPLERQPDFAAFLGWAVTSGRLRFINRFDEQHDLYAVVKTEPESRSEAPLPANVAVREWAALLAVDPINALGKYQAWSEKLLRLQIATYGTLPRYADFMRNLGEIGRGIITGEEDTDVRLNENLRRFAAKWIIQPDFIAAYRQLSDEEFVARVYANAGVPLEEPARTAFENELKEKRATRADVLLKLIDDASFAEREKNRSLVLLHFFAYLRRNPNDPPDNNMRGLEHWVIELNKGFDPALLSPAFASSLEHQRILKQAASQPVTSVTPKATGSK